MKGDELLQGKVYTAPFEKMNRKKDIIKCIESISGKYSSYEVFSDWIKCCSLSISNSIEIFHGKTWEVRERAFLDVTKKYEISEQRKFSEMFVMLVETLEEEMTDVLGQVYMESGMGSKAAGQFFTPYHLSYLTAKLSVLEPDEDGIYRINEPSCGGGGMIIAAAQALKEKGIDYQRKMKVVAQDLDWKGVYMCYLQLSLLGIKAVCVQGNTLAEPYIKSYPPERVLYTPAEKGLLI